MPSVSVAGGWTFTNAGPLTTTFTPAPRCTDNVFVGQTSPEVYLAVRVECESSDQLSGCTPTGTITTTTAASVDHYPVWEASYFSPGIYCPSGWTTVGTAAHDADKSISRSGMMNMTSSLYEDYQIDATALASILDPSETLALCCPSGMKGDWGVGGCWSAIPTSKPTTACEIRVHGEGLEEITKTFTYGTKTVTEDYPVQTGSMSTRTHTVTLEEYSQYSGFVVMSAVPMVTLVHKQSDIEAAKSTAASTTTESEVAATSSNAAGRLNVGSSALDGLSMTVGVCVAAMALGAAIIFQ